MLFNEPKLLKLRSGVESAARSLARFSALQRAEIAEIALARELHSYAQRVSVLFNEPKLLKFISACEPGKAYKGFSALQRAEIAEILGYVAGREAPDGFSALQRAEIAEITDNADVSASDGRGFSALQRAEIAEIPRGAHTV